VLASTGCCVNIDGRNAARAAENLAENLENLASDNVNENVQDTNIELSEKKKKKRVKLKLNEDLAKEKSNSVKQLTVKKSPELPRKLHSDSVVGCITKKSRALTSNLSFPGVIGSSKSYSDFMKKTKQKSYVNDCEDSLNEASMNSEVMEDGILENKSFDQFFLLGIIPDAVTSSVFNFYKHTRYLDPFLCKSVGLLDQLGQTKDSLTSQDVSLFCFAEGAKIRVIPSYALEGAQRLGWVGSKADSYQLHTFTNAVGQIQYGVSITIREVLSNSSNVIPTLKLFRRKRAAAVKIKRFILQYTSNGKESSYIKRFIKKGRRQSILSNNNIKPFLKKIPSSRDRSSTRALLRRTSTSFDNFSSVKTQRNVSRNFDKLWQQNQNFLPQTSQAKKPVNNMLRRDRLGDVCIVEKCFVLIGTSPEEQSLLLQALQQLIDLERSIKPELYSISTNISKHKKCSRIFHSQPLQPISINNQKVFRRHQILNQIQARLRLTLKQTRVRYPKSEVEHVHRKIPRIQLDICDIKISLPLPLPLMSGEWGVATLLLRIKAFNLFAILKLLLLERPVLVIGTSKEEVTACTCALLHLIKPYTWASAFMPLLSEDMLDFVSSPIPFIAGIVVDNHLRLDTIQNDDRIKNAHIDGMSILNITFGTVAITTEAGIQNIVGNHQNEVFFRLTSYQKRLEQLSSKKTSNLLSFKAFFSYGASPHETLTIASVKQTFKRFFTNLFSYVQDEWKKYGEFDEITNLFEFFPSRLVTPLQSQLQFQEMLAHTQLFSSFFEEVTNLDASLPINKEAALVIADWVYFRWYLKKMTSLQKI